MEPITTAAAATAVVSYMAQKLKENKSVGNLFDGITDRIVSWIRPLFLGENDLPKETMEDLKDNPEEPLNQEAAVNVIAKSLKKMPEAEALLMELYEEIQRRKSNGETVSITNSTNVNTGTIKAGGNIIIGNNNTLQS